jgi:hypothetical protein
MKGSLRRRARLGAVVVMAAGAALSWVPAASAVTVEASGWWWRPNTTTAPIAVPPRADVGTDQVLVEGTAEGATAVAAAKFKLAEGETSPILTITTTQDSVVPPDAGVLACRVASAWTAADGGKWEQRPIPDCFTSVQGIPSEGGKFTFALTPLQSDQDLDIVITPGTDPKAANDNTKYSAFSMKFNKPTAADLKTTTGDTSGFTGTGGGFTSPDPSSFGADSGSSSSDFGSSTSPTYDSGSTTFDSGSSSSFGASPAFSQPSTFTPPATVAAPAAAAVSPQEQADARGVAPVQAAPVAAKSEAPKNGRTLGILVLLAGAALGFWAYTGSALGGGGAVAPVPVAPPPGSEPVIGGLGRFARPRLGPPPTLS